MQWTSLWLLAPLRGPGTFIWGFHRNSFETTSTWVPQLNSKIELNLLGDRNRKQEALFLFKKTESLTFSQLMLFCFCVKYMWVKDPVLSYFYMYVCMSFQYKMFPIHPRVLGYGYCDSVMGEVTWLKATSDLPASSFPKMDYGTIKKTNCSFSPHLISCVKVIFTWSQCCWYGRIQANKFEIQKTTSHKKCRLVSLSRHSGFIAGNLLPAP